MKSGHGDLLLPRKILVTGGSGFIGSRLIPQLLEGRSQILVMTRDKEKIRKQSWKDQVDVCIADAQNMASLEIALEGIHTAYYLLHSMTMGADFKRLEAINAKNFATAAGRAGVKQIVYLGGIANDRRLSKHMQSRVNTGRLLHAGLVPTLEIRAGIIIGSGSASFRLLRDLTNEIPFLTTPKWINNRTQPVCISDVLYYLSSAAELRKPIDGIFDIGGPNILTYSKLIRRLAHLSGLETRRIINLPFPSPALASLLIGIFTKLPTALARSLVGSLVSEVIADPRKSLNGIIDLPPNGLLDLDKSIELAISTDNHHYQTHKN